MPIVLATPSISDCGPRSICWPNQTASEQTSYANEFKTALEADSRKYRSLINRMQDALKVALKRVRWNFKTAIPHYFPTLKRLDFLLPLCLLDDSTVDVALAVQRTETGYIGDTILPLDWAYKSARLVCRPDSDWLAPKKIDAGEEPGND